MATMRLDVFHTGLELRMPELTFSSDKTVGDVKENLYRRTGTEVKNMELWLVDSLGRRMQNLSDPTEKLSQVLPPEAEQAGWELHIIDTDDQSLTATKAIFEGEVPKYEAPHGRKDFSEFRRAKRLEQAGKSGSPVAGATTGMAEAAEFDDGDRVVLLKDGLKGTVRYIGKCASAAPGFFIGVELDEPKGKHDGSVKGKRLFECEPNHGILVRPFAIRKMRYADMGDDREEI